jgi:hypothetical protein
MVPLVAAKVRMHSEHLSSGFERVLLKSLPKTMKPISNGLPGDSPTQVSAAVCGVSVSSFYSGMSILLDSGDEKRVTWDFKHLWLLFEIIICRSLVYLLPKIFGPIIYPCFSFSTRPLSSLSLTREILLDRACVYCTGRVSLRSPTKRENNLDIDLGTSKKLGPG